MLRPPLAARSRAASCRSNCRCVAHRWVGCRREYACVNSVAAVCDRRTIYFCFERCQQRYQQKMLKDPPSLGPRCGKYSPSGYGVAGELRSTNQLTKPKCRIEVALASSSFEYSSLISHLSFACRAVAFAQAGVSSFCRHFLLVNFLV